MGHDSRSNVFNLLKDKFEIYDTVLDVGCGEEPWDLYDFELSIFKKLIGFDEDPNITHKALKFY
jgi:hypothetical protein